MRNIITIKTSVMTLYESKIAPYAGIPRDSIPYTTFLVIFGFEMMKTASALDSRTRR